MWVEISSNGLTIAVGASDGDIDYGYVSIYDFEGSSWVLQTKVENIFSTSSLAMSKSGNCLASYVSREIANNDPGIVYFITPNTDRSSAWAFDEIYIESSMVGSSVNSGAIAVSDDCSKFVVGSRWESSVHIYSKQTGEWELDKMYVGGPSSNEFGASVAIIPEGTMIAVGALASDILDSTFKVFEYDSSSVSCFKKVKKIALASVLSLHYCYIIEPIKHWNWTDISSIFCKFKQFL
jgi:hypothetical protein